MVLDELRHDHRDEEGVQGADDATVGDQVSGDGARGTRRAEKGKLLIRA
jgi:hypothetical protein